MNDDLENYFYNNEDPDLDLLKDEEREYIRKQSMENTYTLIVNNYDFEIFPDKLFWLLTDFDELSVFDVLLEYFVEQEEYEKCAVLVNIKERHKRWDASRATKRGKFTYKLDINLGDEEDSPLD
ncbi:MAG: hypothetical protein Unbinned838contig1000_71 [Prokaryotic dsDNA virus sp.]|nr:MAG: hypothetical protein Unbinned838contig1000_71 [Prokaryotic dsDNA virus sp.]|tara:strand:+ start:37349 stop:37720 length:372 start_codon:yes stop_codon:yes gene_type:complete